MFEAIIRALIALVLIVVAFFVVLWVLATLGITLPPIVITGAKIILALICILWLYRLLRPHASGWLP
jgi:hypothetical protein